MIDVERVVTLDELMDRVPEHLVRDAESRIEELDESPTENLRSMNKEPSKAQRIRSYLEENPEARNRDVVKALAEYEIKAADVANVKSQMKRAEAKSESPRRRTAAAPAPSAPVATSTSNSKATPIVTGDGGPSLNLRDLEAAVSFVKTVGSIQAAQHLLIIVEQIKGA